MTEREYRVKCLRQRMGSIRNKKIALYGIGVNAKFILEEFSDLNILALLDEKHAGEYYHGKKVISLQQAVILGIQVILIAAKVDSACLISDRIRDFCFRNGIELLNIYGLDEIMLQRNVLNQELSYLQCTETMLRNEILDHDTICVQLPDVLYAYGRPEKEMLEQETIIPKKQMVDIINWAMALEKKMYLLSAVQISEKKMDSLLQEIGIVECSGGKGYRVVYSTSDYTAIGKIALENLDDRMLYIGTNDSYNLIVPQMYGMDIFLIKSAEDIFGQFSTLSRDRKIVLDGENKNEVYRYIQYSYISPFVCEYGETERQEKLLLPLDLIEGEECWVNYEPKIYAPLIYNKLDELEKIVFSEYRKPSVSIIVPVYNQFAYTYNCLRAIREYTTEVDYEVIIADDCSDDDTLYLESIVKGAKIVRNERNLLFVLNCNNAAKYARGKYIVFLNNDTQVQPGWLKALVQLAEAESNIGLIGSQLLYPDGTLQEAGGIVWENGCACNYGRECSSGAPEYNYVREVDYISGAAIMIRRDLWNEIGGFDERYVPAYCEDSDLAFEVRRHGKRVMYQPASKVVHFEGMSNGTDVTCGVKASQLLNMVKFREKWQEVLSAEKHVYGMTDIFVRDRKGDRKVILVVGPDISQEYLNCVLEKSDIVKFVPEDFAIASSIVEKYQQMGIAVLAGEYYRKNIAKWILNNQKDIDVAYVIGNKSRNIFACLLSCTSIKTYFSDNM